MEELGSLPERGHRIGKTFLAGRSKLKEKKKRLVC